jgi:hypothetical protein
MKKMGIAVAMVSLMATGAYAANTAKQVQSKPTLAQAQAAKIAMLKKKKRVDMTTTSRGAPQPLTKRQEQQDAVTTSSSSATSAATAPMTAGTSATEAQSVGAKKRFIDNVRAGVVVEFYGPSPADPFSGRQPDIAKGYSQSDNALNFYHHVNLGYAVNDNLTISLDPYFQTIGASADGSEGGTPLRFREQYSYINFKLKKILKTRKFTYNGGLRVYPGIGELNKGRPLYLRHDMNLVYAVTPRMNVAMYNTLRGYVRSQTAYDKDPSAFDLRATVGPTVEYQFADSLGSYLSYVVDVRHQRETGKIVDAPIDEAPYVELGASWDVMKRVNLNPYVDAYTNMPNFEAWQLGANLAISFL